MSHEEILKQRDYDHTLFHARYAANTAAAR
jgi:hypothetical protein